MRGSLDRPWSESARLLISSGGHHSQEAELLTAPSSLLSDTQGTHTTRMAQQQQGGGMPDDGGGGMDMGGMSMVMTFQSFSTYKVKGQSSQSICPRDDEGCSCSRCGSPGREKPENGGMSVRTTQTIDRPTYRLTHPPPGFPCLAPPPHHHHSDLGLVERRDERAIRRHSPRPLRRRRALSLPRPPRVGLCAADRRGRRRRRCRGRGRQRGARCVACGWVLCAKHRGSIGLS